MSYVCIPSLHLKLKWWVIPAVKAVGILIHLTGIHHIAGPASQIITRHGISKELSLRKVKWRDSSSSAS